MESFRETGAPDWIATLSVRIFFLVAHLFSFRGVTKSGASLYRGATQGNLVAPYFFVNLFEPLLRSLKRTLDLGERVVAYADDVVIILLFIFRLSETLPIFWMLGAASGCLLHMLKSGWVYGKRSTFAEKKWWHLLPPENQQGQPPTCR